MRLLQPRRHGGFEVDPRIFNEAVYQISKVSGSAGWVTGVRRDEAPTRAGTPVIGWDDKHDMVKVNPLATWTAADVEAYQVAHDLPRNPLVAQGYPSIGCEPCTRPVLPGQHEREGRWWWEAATQKECGLHATPPPESRSI